MSPLDSMHRLSSPQQNTTEFVELDNLTLAYGKTVAVEDLSLGIRKGELIALLGPVGLRQDDDDAGHRRPLEAALGASPH